MTQPDPYRAALRTTNYAMILVVGFMTAAVAVIPDLKANGRIVIAVVMVVFSLLSFWNIEGGLWMPAKHLGYPHNQLVKRAAHRFLLGSAVAVPVGIALGTYSIQDVVLAIGIFFFVTTLSAGSLPFLRLAWDDVADMQKKASELFGSGFPRRDTGLYDATRQADGRFVVTDKSGGGPTICYECFSLVTPTDRTCWRCGDQLPGSVE